MKYAADYREIARRALKGNWLVATATGFVASLMGATIATAGSAASAGNSSDAMGNITEGIVADPAWQWLLALLVVGVLVLACWCIVTLIIGGAGQLGYATYNVNLIDGNQARFKDLFSRFHRLGDGFCMKFLMALYTALWSMLFVIPGIIKQFSYAMTPYVLAENPGMTASEAITQSRRIMDGNKWRLFCLRVSFIGWRLLCSLPGLIAVIALTGAVLRAENAFLLLWMIPASIPTFIGAMFLRPYEEAAQAAFYRDLVGSPKVIQAENGEEVWLEF